MTSISSAWRRRALPMSIAALRGVKFVSYSQFGEDVIVNALFGHLYPVGFYIDVGCFHPIRWSNTYAFYLKGWRGICIDPNSTFVPLWRHFRSRDEFIDIGVSDTESEAVYVKNARISQENYVRTAKNDLWSHEGDILHTRLERLDSVLDRCMNSEQTIDLMSIDCEGYDLCVLRSNDFARFRPRLLIIEDMQSREDSGIATHLEDVDYQLVAHCGPSKVFRDREWKRMIEETTRGGDENTC